MLVDLSSFPFLKMGHFLPLFCNFRLYNPVFGKQMFNIDFANDQIRTADLCCRKQLLCQKNCSAEKTALPKQLLCQNNCSAKTTAQFLSFFPFCQFFTFCIDQPQSLFVYICTFQTHNCRIDWGLLKPQSQAGDRFIPTLSLGETIDEHKQCDQVLE